ncbi:hypothetical protein NC651_011816 [Populus alba x Populus x berolinensis]|nr:hypothetical protein NC651_011816 [Populus alba x Populus x berolinensis]
MATYNFPGFQKKEKGRENLWRSHFKSGIESCFEQLSVEGFFERCSKEKQDYNNCFELIINGWNVVPLIQRILLLSI